MDGMFIENMEFFINLMDIEVDIWGICLSLLFIVYEYKMIEVVVYLILV